MKRMESLFTDLEHERRIEVSRLNGGLLLGHILEYLENPYIHPETGHKVHTCISNPRNKDVHPRTIIRFKKT